jgi:serine/threonine protein kinase
MFPQLTSIGIKLGDGAQATVYSSHLEWHCSRDTSNSTASARCTDVAVKVFGKPNAWKIAASEASMLLLAERLGIKPGQVRQNLLSVPSVLKKLLDCVPLQILPTPIQVTSPEFSPSLPCLAYPKYQQDLFAVLANSGVPMPVTSARSVIASILLAIARLHEIGIVHLDLKHENILMSSSHDPVIADFGFSRCARANAGAMMTVADSQPSTGSPGAAHGRASAAAVPIGTSIRYTAGAKIPTSPNREHEALFKSLCELPACSEHSGVCFCSARHKLLAGNNSALPTLPAEAYMVHRRDAALGAFTPPQCWTAVPRLDGRMVDTFAVGVLASYCLSLLGVGIDMHKGLINLPNFGPAVPEDAIDFVRQATQFWEADRPTAEQLLAHPWLAGAVAQLQSELDGAPCGCMHAWWCHPEALLTTTVHFDPGAGCTRQGTALEVTRAALGPAPVTSRSLGTLGEIESGSGSDNGDDLGDHDVGFTVTAADGRPSAYLDALLPVIAPPFPCTPLTQSLSEGDLMCHSGSSQLTSAEGCDMGARTSTPQRNDHDHARRSMCRHARSYVRRCVTHIGGSPLQLRLFDADCARAGNCSIGIQEYKEDAEERPSFQNALQQHTLAAS